MTIKDELIIEAASKMHNNYCEEELKDFFARIQKIKKIDATKQPIEILEEACFDNGNKRNDIVLDVDWLNSHNEKVLEMLTDYDIFIELFNIGVCKVKDFVVRNLDEEEIKKAITQDMDQNYKIETGEENILRPFNELSNDSKKENLFAALGAYNIYEQLSKAGVTIKQMESNPKIRNLIGIAIHTDWLKRNMDHEYDSLKVPYKELTTKAKKQDLTVFYSLLSVVISNGKKYAIKTVPGTEIVDYESLEQETLQSDNK